MSRKTRKNELTSWARFDAWLNGTLYEEGQQTNGKSQEDMLEEKIHKSRGKERRKYLHIAKRPSVFQKYHLSRFARKLLSIYDGLYRCISVITCIIVIAVLVYTVSFLPAFGSPNAPDNNEVSARYIEQGLEETKAINIVTGMILDYRAFDTFGEANVLFVASSAVLILLRRDTRPVKNKKSKRALNNSQYVREQKPDPILRVAAKVLVPPIFIFGVYVILNGHLSPGGGFSGGTILGVALILYLNAFGEERIQRFFTTRTSRTVVFGALTFYAVSKSYSFYTGANHIESIIPQGTAGNILSGGLLLPLNICVGLVVACTMYGIYVLFSRGGM